MKGEKYSKIIDNINIHHHCSFNSCKKPQQKREALQFQPCFPFCCVAIPNGGWRYVLVNLVLEITVDKTMLEERLLHKAAKKLNAVSPPLLGLINIQSLIVIGVDVTCSWTKGIKLKDGNQVTVAGKKKPQRFATFLTFDWSLFRNVGPSLAGSEAPSI